MTAYRHSIAQTILKAYDLGKLDALNAAAGRLGMRPVRTRADALAFARGLEETGKTSRALGVSPRDLGVNLRSLRR